MYILHICVPFLIRYLFMFLCMFVLYSTRMSEIKIFIGSEQLFDYVQLNESVSVFTLKTNTTTENVGLQHHTRNLCDA